MTEPLSELWLVRHGATEWSQTGRHTSRTDVALLPSGADRARALLPRLTSHDFALVLTSPLQRARETARLAGYPDAEVDGDLREWDYGVYEGLTTAGDPRDRPGLDHLDRRHARRRDRREGRGPRPTGDRRAARVRRATRSCSRTATSCGC